MSNSSSTSERIASRQKTGEFLFWPARVLLLLLLVLLPWYYGSVRWQTQTLIVPCVVVILLLTIGGALLQHKRSANPLVWSLAALLLLSLAQTVRLPEFVWQVVSPSASFERQVQPTVDEFQQSLVEKGESQEQSLVAIEPPPRTWSIHWVQSRASASMLAAALACLIAGGVLFHSRNWELVLLCVLGLTGLAVAVLGLLQSVAWNKWTLLPMPTSTYFATFVSRNSAPQYLAIGLGACMGLLAWWTNSKSDEADKKYYVRYPAVNAVARLRRRVEELLTDLDAVSLLCVFTATFLFVAVLAAGSRGGILACIAASIITLCLTLGTKQSYARTVGLVTAMVAGGMMLMTTLELDSAMFDRMDSVNEEAYKLDNGRFTVWYMILSQPSVWIAGCGLGNFHFAILPTYNSAQVWFYHAENVYLEVLTELGVLGFAIALFGLGWLFWRIRWCVLNGRRSAPTFVATTLAVCAVALQSLVDFSLILPSICLPLATLAGCFVGRSYAIDFGKSVKRRAARRKTRDSADPIETPVEEKSAIDNWQAFGLLAIILLAVWLGTKPMAGFAFAEGLQGQLKQIRKTPAENSAEASQRLLDRLDIKQMERFADHPEVNLEVAMLYQNFVQQSLLEQIQWPKDISQQQKLALSEPSQISASFRSSDDQRMAEMQKLLSGYPQQIEALKRSTARMAAAASMCPYDWRGHWGSLRSDVASFDRSSRAMYFARILHTTRHSDSLLAKAGAAAFIAGEREIGSRLIRDFLDRNPKQTVRIASSIVDQVPEGSSTESTVALLDSILPETALPRAEVAQQFSGIEGRRAVGQSLGRSLDMDRVFEEAESRTQGNARDPLSWLLAAWIAELNGNQQKQSEALENAVNADPMNHDLRFRLATVFQGLGKFDEAVQQAERASRLSPETRLYKDFMESIRKK